MTILHVDANSAYLSWTAVALLEKGYPTDIRTIPSAIAGDPDNRHGIILAKSIPAKKYQIKTGESLFSARQKCPNLQVFPPDYDLFLMCSDAMYQMLCAYTPLVQRYSVDECFMEVQEKEPVVLAYEIKESIKKKLGFTVNVGIGKNKLCAKMAGELKKPDLVHTLWPEEIPQKLWPLPVEDLFMVGRATAKKLEKLRIQTIGQLANAEVAHLRALLKSHGQLVWEYANGIDHSRVTPNAEIEQKGVGNSTTLPANVSDLEELKKVLLALSERVGMRLRKLKKRASLVAVHLKTASFVTYRHQVQLQTYINSTTEIYEIAVKLTQECWKREAIRQVGVSVSKLCEEGEVQMNFLEDVASEKQEALDRTIDQIRCRYGETSIIRGTFANTKKEPLLGGVNDGNYIMMGGYQQ